MIRLLLPFVLMWLASVAVLLGVQAACAAGVIAFLRRRFPSWQEQRAFLLRGMAYRFPRLSETQRLERIGYAGWGLTIAFIGYPSSIFAGWLYRWLGWVQTQPAGWNETVSFRIRLASALLSLGFMLTFAAYALAVGRLAREGLRQSRTAFPAASAA